VYSCQLTKDANEFNRTQSVACMSCRCAEPVERLFKCEQCGSLHFSTVTPTHTQTHTTHTKLWRGNGLGKTLGATIDRIGTSCALLPSNINPIVGTIQFRKRSVSLRLFSFASPHQLFVPVSAGTGQGESIAKIRTKLGDTS
jgi:hypothetical protein